MATTKRPVRKPGDPVPERKRRKKKELHEYPEALQPSIKAAWDAEEKKREAKKKYNDERAIAYKDEASVAWVLLRQARTMLQQGGEGAKQMETFCKAAIEGCQPIGNYTQERADKDKTATLRFLETNKKAT